MKNLKNVIVARAELYENIRCFFKRRHVFPVETPSLSLHTVTDAYIDSFQIKNKPTYFLQTSPEYAMKRLIAQGAGDIYQICKAFRVDEAGSQHNPEFSMLEWYRMGFTHHDLMNDVNELLEYILKSKPAEKISYQDLFLKCFDIDPLTATKNELQSLIEHQNIEVNIADLDADTLLQIVLSHCIEPDLGFEQPVFIYDFPKSQAALSKIRDDLVGERFELYLNGMEIANGFHELCDATEQRKRFLADQTKRQSNHQFVPAIDERLLSALSDLPSCAGVALGLDRLLMCQLNVSDIKEVLCFPWNKA